jgi:CubicO group peptidase (beta-lactamase class C family)
MPGSARHGVRGLLFLLLLVGPASSPASSQGALQRLDGAALDAAAMDAQVQSLMAAETVTGLGVALIRNGRVTFQKSYGLRDRERGLPLEADTVMYGASLTKAAFAWMVMQLVDEGLVALDRPIGDYLPRPLPEHGPYADLAGDERWRRLTMRMLLSHTSGFANFRALDGGKLRFHRDPGARYGYSGEGFRLAQFVLERGLGLDVGAEMERRIFRRFGMTRTAMTWRRDFAANLAQGYGEDGKLIPHDQRDNVSAAGSMDTTLADMGRFIAAVARGEGLSVSAHAEMVKLQIAIDSPRQFPTLLEERTDRWQSIRLGYGLGWGVFETPFGPAFFKEGHDDGTANYALCVGRDCILMLSNSVRAERIFATLVEALFGKVGLPAEWEGFAPAKS